MFGFGVSAAADLKIVRKLKAYCGRLGGRARSGSGEMRFSIWGRVLCALHAIITEHSVYAPRGREAGLEIRAVRGGGFSSPGRETKRALDARVLLRFVKCVGKKVII